MDLRELQQLDIQSDLTRAFAIGERSGHVHQFAEGLARANEISEALVRLGDSDLHLTVEGWLDIMSTAVRIAEFVDEVEHFEVSRLATRAAAAVAAGLVEDARVHSGTVDRALAFRRWFDLSVEDSTGLIPFVERRIAASACQTVDFEELRATVEEHLNAFLIPFPTRPGERVDQRRAVLRAVRTRLWFILGEAHAGLGRHDLAVDVASSLLETDGYGGPLVRALTRAGRHREAIVVARQLIESPRTLDVHEVRSAVRDSLGGSHNDHQSKADIEALFLRTPGRDLFLALKSSVPGEQWNRVRERILGHLERHRKEPTVLFLLYLDEGMILEADGVVFTQVVEPDSLVAGAERIFSQRPAMAAGWLMTAAYRVSDRHGIDRIDDVITWLKSSSHHVGLVEFEGALRGFRARFSHHPEFIAQLDAAGLSDR